MLDSWLWLTGKLFSHFLSWGLCLDAASPEGPTLVLLSRNTCFLWPLFSSRRHGYFLPDSHGQVVMTLVFSISCHAVCIHDWGHKGTTSLVVTHSETAVECIWKQMFRMLFTQPGNNINGGCLGVWGWRNFCCLYRAWLHNPTWTVLITLLL